MAEKSEEAHPRAAFDRGGATNRGRIRWPSPKFLRRGLILACCFIFHWKRTEGEVESARQTLLAQQRGVKAELGPRWFPLRDKVERWSLELAKGPAEDVVDKDALAQWDFRTKAGIYLRMRASDASTADAIRAGAKDSLRDAFTSCLVTFPNPNAFAGAECKHTRDCPSGEYCNETDHCSKAAQPFNLRVAYRTMNILTDKWVEEVQEAEQRHPHPRARRRLRRHDPRRRAARRRAADARPVFLLLVLDEGAPAAASAGADAGATADTLLAQAHSARVGLWRLTDDKLILRLRRQAGGDLIGAGPPVDDAVLAASRRSNT